MNKQRIINQVKPEKIKGEVRLPNQSVRVGSNAVGNIGKQAPQWVGVSLWKRKLMLQSWKARKCKGLKPKYNGLQKFLWLEFQVICFMKLMFTRLECYVHRWILWGQDKIEDSHKFYSKEWTEINRLNNI